MSVGLYHDSISRISRLLPGQGISYKVSRLLAGLGNTCDEVAASLGRLGIKGIPGRSKDCALAVYLRRELDRPVTVGSSDVEIDARDFFVVIPHSEPVRAFIRRFDVQKYPDLLLYPVEGTPWNEVVKADYSHLPGIKALKKAVLDGLIPGDVIQFTFHSGPVPEEDTKLVAGEYIHSGLVAFAEEATDKELVLV